jgi:hypothetical protein
MTSIRRPPRSDRRAAPGRPRPSRRSRLSRTPPRPSPRRDPVGRAGRPKRLQRTRAPSSTLLLDRPCRGLRSPAARDAPLAVRRCRASVRRRGAPAGRPGRGRCAIRRRGVGPPEVPGGTRTAAARRARAAAGGRFEGAPLPRHAGLRSLCCDRPKSWFRPPRASGPAHSPDHRASSDWTTARTGSRGWEAHRSPPQLREASVWKAGRPGVWEPARRAPRRQAPAETACWEPQREAPATGSASAEERELREAVGQPRLGQGIAQPPPRRRPAYAWRFRPPCFKNYPGEQKKPRGIRIRPCEVCVTFAYSIHTDVARRCWPM